MYKKRALFYPCAGRDIDTPIKAFASIIDEFWFIDTSRRVYQRPLLPSRTPRDSVNTTTSILSGTDFSVITHQYKFLPFNKTIDVNLVTGDGIIAFSRLFHSDKAARELSVFFHRGDSRGEGGSDVYWLNSVDGEGNPNDLLGRVLNTLASPGIICTDGSNATEVLSKYFDDRDASPNAHVTLEDITLFGSTLSPISTLDSRYGQTIVWEVSRI